MPENLLKKFFVTPISIFVFGAILTYRMIIYNYNVWLNSKIDEVYIVTNFLFKYEPVFPQNHLVFALENSSRERLSLLNVKALEKGLYSFLNQG